MVGYLSLTIIVDRIICDPLYGASNFGDIKDLILKMVETCTYEQVLFAKTSVLVAKDVYHNMQVFKRYSGKSFSPLTDFCQYCSKPLDFKLNGGNRSVASADSFIYVPPNAGLSPEANKYPELTFDSNNKIQDSDPKMSINIFHCGHSFHQTCLEIAQSNSFCPICKNSSNSNQASKNNKPNKSKISDKSNSKLSPGNEIDQNDEVGQTLLPASPNSSPAFTLTQSQVAALKEIRSRTLTSFILNESGNVAKNLNKQSSNLIEKQSKLKLAPANIAKIV